MRDRIFNKAFLDFNICGRTKTIESNVVETHKIDIRIEKAQCCPFCFEGDEHEFAVKITNKCMRDIENLRFKDFLDDDLHYVRHTFKVDGHTEEPNVSGREISYDIHKLHAHQEMVITFKTRVH